MMCLQTIFFVWIDCSCSLLFCSLICESLSFILKYSFILQIILCMCVNSNHFLPVCGFFLTLFATTDVCNFYVVKSVRLFYLWLLICLVRKAFCFTRLQKYSPILSLSTYTMFLKVNSPMHLEFWGYVVRWYANFIFLSNCVRYL